MEVDLSLPEKQPLLYAVAGGKGGCGKSLICSTIAVNLVKRTKTPALIVDADLGGANLHSFFRVRNSPLTLKNFFLDKKELSGLIIPAGCENLSFICGDYNYLDRDINNYQKRQAFFRQLQQLTFPRIFLDVGAGSHNFCLETAAIADRLILITLPDIISVENLYLFLKKVILKKIKLRITHANLKSDYEEFCQRKGIKTIDNFENFLKLLREHSPLFDELITTVFKQSRFYLILNQVRNQAHCELGGEISYVLRKWLHLPVDYSGYLYFYENLWQALDGRSDFWSHPATTNFQNQVYSIFEMIDQGRER